MKGKLLLGEIAAYLNVELRGDPLLQILGLNTLKEAREGEIAFLANPKYVKDLPSCNASVVILSLQHADCFSGHCLITDHPIWPMHVYRLSSIRLLTIKIPHTQVLQ